MPFSDVLNDYKNQIGVQDAPAKSGANALVALATGIVGEFKDYRKKTVAEEAAQEMSKLEESLSAAVSKGTISITEKQTRLNAKQRELSANHPTIAAEIKESIKETLGGLPTVTSAQANVNEDQLQQDLEHKELEAATVAGLRINKPDGTIDKQRTAKAFRDVQLALLDLKANKGGGTDEQRSANRAAHSQYFGKAMNAAVLPTIQRLQLVASATKGDDAAKFGAALDEWNNVASNYINSTVIPALNESGLDPADQKTVLENEQAKLKSFHDLLFTENSAGFNRRTQTVAKLGEHFQNDLAEQIPGLIAANKALGDQGGLFVDSVLSANPDMKNAIDGMIRKGIVGDTSPSTTINDAMDSATGARDPKTLSPARKASVAKSLTNVVSTYSREQNLGAKDLQTFAGSCGALADLISNEGSSTDMEKAVKKLDTPVCYSRLSELAAGGDEGAEFGKAALASMNELSTKVLGNVKQGDTRNTLAEVLYNPTSGAFEVVPIKAAVDKALSAKVSGPNFLMKAGVTGQISALKPTAEKMSKALNMATKTRMTGDAASLKDAEVRQYLVDSLGFRTNPSIRKREVSENVQKQLTPPTKSQGPVRYKFDPATGTVTKKEQ